MNYIDTSIEAPIYCVPLKSQVQAGYQSVLRMVIDLAYRMALLNPDAGDRIRMAEGIID